jgi:hypothetical protein
MLKSEFDEYVFVCVCVCALSFFLIFHKNPSKHSTHFKSVLCLSLSLIVVCPCQRENVREESVQCDFTAHIW